MLSTKPPPLPPQATTKALLPVLASSIKVHGEAALKTTSKFWEASKNSSKVKTKKNCKKTFNVFFLFPQIDNLRPAAGGLLGGAASTLLLHPLDLLKTRQAVYANCEGAKSSSSKYAKVGSAVKEAVRCGGGLRGLYAGVGANVVVSSSSWGIYFMA